MMLLSLRLRPVGTAQDDDAVDGELRRRLLALPGIEHVRLSRGPDRVDLSVFVRRDAVATPQDSADMEDAVVATVDQTHPEWVVAR